MREKYQFYLDIQQVFFATLPNIVSILLKKTFSLLARLKSAVLFPTKFFDSITSYRNFVSLSGANSELNKNLVPVEAFSFTTLLGKVHKPAYHYNSKINNNKLNNLINDNW